MPPLTSHDVERNVRDGKRLVDGKRVVAERDVERNVRDDKRLVDGKRVVAERCRAREDVRIARVQPYRRREDDRD